MHRISKSRALAKSWLESEGYTVFEVKNSTKCGYHLIAHKPSTISNIAPPLHVYVRTLNVKADGNLYFKHPRSKHKRVLGITTIWVHPGTDKVGWNRDYF